MTKLKSITIVLIVIMSIVFIRVANAEAPSDIGVEIIGIIPEKVMVPVLDDPVKQYAYDKIAKKWGGTEWEAFNKLVMKESGWDNTVRNKTSGACGIPQALPCHKMGLDDWTDPYGQVDWMIQYIHDRYSSPSKALSFHLENNWY